MSSQPNYGANVPADEITPWWQTYLDIDNDVKPYLQIDPGVVTYDATLKRIVDMSCVWVQNYLGRPIAPTTFFRRLSGWTGWNGSYLSLPFYPILEIISLVEYWGLNGQHTLVYQTPEQQGGPGEELYQVDWIRGILVRSFQGLIQRPFFPGSNNIECTWIAGYNPVPPDIMFATVELVAYWYRMTQEQPRWFPAGASDEYGGQQTASMLYPGIPDRVKVLLAPYVQQGIG